MLTIFQTCQPRQEVLDGNWTDDTFAAKLHTVHAGTAPATYQDPQKFFANTYPTAGLRELLREALGRLSGKDGTANPVIRLETAFGGGKTHNLIALYHLARLGEKARSISALGQFVDPALLPAEPIRTAVLVGQVLDVAQGMEHPEDGIVTRTLWGEIAFQLGGKAAYQAVAEADRTGLAPGMAAMEKALGSGPVLIIIDELAHYLRKANDARIGDANLGRQTVAFLHTLTELVSARPQTVLVLTLADRTNAYAEETETLAAGKLISEAGDITARSERVIIPAQEEDLAPILRRRLFERVDLDAGRKVAEAYVDYYRDGFAKGAPLPEEVTTSAYVEKIARTYPFHPDLIETLDKKVATIAEFQKTRGALRLLAAMIRQLWVTQPGNVYLLQSCHVDLSVERVQSDLTGRIGRAEYVPIIRADIFVEDGTAHAQKLNGEFAPLGFPDLVRQVAQTVYLHTLVRTVQPGLTGQELLVACGQPGLPFEVLQKAVGALADTAWYMATDGRRYWFQVEPSINKVIQDEISMVGRTEAKQRIREEMKSYYAGSLLRLVAFPKHPGDLEDKPAQPQLVLIDFDTASVQGADPSAPALVRRLFNEKGHEGATTFRRFKNTLFFLVADADHIESMIQKAQLVIALERLVSSQERMAVFKEQQKAIRTRKDEAAIQLRIAITSCYKHLYYADPYADTFAASATGLGHHTLAPTSHSETRRMEDILVQVLRDLKKLHDPEQTLAPAFLRAKLWGVAEQEMSTEAFYHRFSEKSTLPLVTDPNDVRRMILRGIEEKAWVYDDGVKVYGNLSPHFQVPALTQVTIDSLCKLILFEEAEKRGLLTPPKPPVCERCGQSPCVCSSKGTGPKPVVCPICGQHPCRCQAPPSGVEPVPPQEGLVPEVFARLRDHMMDKKIETIPGVKVLVVGAPNIRMALPHLPTIASLAPKYHLEWAQEATGQGRVEIIAEGNWDLLREAKAGMESLPTGQQWQVDGRLTIRVKFDSPAAADDQRLAQLEGALKSLPNPVRLTVWRG